MTRSYGWQIRQIGWQHTLSASPVPIEKSADLEMDGSGESGGFSRTVGGRIAYKSKDADNT